jgi:hypothetical protein
MFAGYGNPKKPHAAPPKGILSVWKIKENRVDNDLLIIVNDWVTPHAIFPDHARAAIMLTTMRPGWGQARA